MTREIHGEAVSHGSDSQRYSAFRVEYSERLLTLAAGLLYRVFPIATVEQWLACPVPTARARVRILARPIGVQLTSCSFTLAGWSINGYMGNLGR